MGGILEILYIIKEKQKGIKFEFFKIPYLEINYGKGTALTKIKFLSKEDKMLLKKKKYWKY